MVARSPRLPLWRRVLAVLAGLAMGVFIGSVTTVIHQSSLDVAAISIPWGIVAALLIVAGFLAGLRLATESRLVALFGAIGVELMVFLLSQRSQGGSVLVPANLAGNIWAAAPAIIGVVVLAWPHIPAKVRG
jgi:asparagine N-glycosylation enzyme membrane subunit Stt3